jgi:hypothetical protein
MLGHEADIVPPEAVVDQLLHDLPRFTHIVK